MNDTQRLAADKKRRRREFYIILVIVPIVLLLTFLESHVSLISGDIPIATNIFILGLININMLLLVLLIFLVLRNTVKLYLERRKRVMGSRLRTKLVSSFILLTIVPTMLLFFVVIGFINRSIDGWFGIQIEDSLKESLELGQNYYRDITDRLASSSRKMSVAIGRDVPGLKDREKLRAFVSLVMDDNDFSTIEVYSSGGDRLEYFISSRVSKTMVPDIDMSAVARAVRGEASSFVQTMKVGDVVRAVSPVPSVDPLESPVGAVVVS